MDEHPDHPTSEELEVQQDARVHDEERAAAEADQPAEAHTHERRADKAAYLRDKLAEAAEADREA
jgi:hypothetical protein